MDEVEVTRNGRTNQFSVTPVHGSDTIRCIVSVASVSIPDERSDWASKTPIVVHPLWSDPRWQRPLLNFASAPGDFVLAASLVRADEDCIITRPGGVEGPGVTNNKGECCSSSGHRIGSTWPRYPIGDVPPWYCPAAF